MAPEQPVINASPEPAAAPDRGWRVHAIINENSGAGSQGGAIAPALETVATARGWSIRTETVPGKQLEGAIQSALKAEPDALIVGGGDGTIRTALSRVMGTQTALGIIPLGTMNFVAKDLSIPIPTGDAIASLATAVVRCVDVGEVNGLHFFHSSAIGIVPTLAAARERIREATGWRDRLGRFVGALRTAATARPLTLVLEHHGKREGKRTFSLIVANNPLSSDPLTPYRRHVVDGGELSAYVAHHEGRLGIARLLFTFGSGWWFWDHSIAEIRAASLRVHSRRKRIHVSNDGEVDVLMLPLRYKSHRCAVRVLAPPPPSTPSPPPPGDPKAPAPATP